LYGLSEGVEYLKYTFVNSFACRIESLDLDDPILPKVQEKVLGGNTFPLEANAFILRIENLPLPSNVTKGFVRHSADDIVLIGLAFAEIVRDGTIKKVFRQTQTRLIEYSNARQRLGPQSPYLVRPTAFKQRDWFLFKGRVFRGSSTDILLDRWRQ
jgi:hypothetical protein